MKISFVIQDITFANGTERTTSLLANTFCKKGHDVTIISVFKSFQNPSFPLDKKINVRFLLHEEYTHQNSLFTIGKQYIKAILSLRKNLKENSTDIIIGQNFLINLFLFICGFASITLACEHFKYGIYNKIIRAYRNHMYKKFQRVIVLNESDAKQYQKRGIDATVIPNMVSFPIISTILPNDKKRIISVGRLSYEKGYDLLLYSLKDVFQKFPDWHIDIYGEGKERKTLEELRDRLGLTKYVHFLGYTKDIQTEYLNSSFYILSSRHEGFPMVLLEAMACGLPTISFNCPTGPGVLLSDDTGYLVPPENTKAMNKAIYDMISNKNLRDSYAIKSIEKAHLYSPENIYNQWNKLFTKLHS